MNFSSKSKNKNYTQEAVEHAFQMVREKKMTLGQAAKVYGIPKTTLGDKLRGKFALHVTPQTVLTKEEEEKLVAWLVESTRRGCGRSKQQLLTTVQHIIRADGRPNPFTNSRPGNKWYLNFMSRHPQLSRGKSQALSQQRALVTEAGIRAWFNKAERALLEDGVDVKTVARDRMFNCDRYGFPFHTKTGYGLSSKDDRQVYSVNSDNKQQITVLACGSASGQLMKPLITYPGQRFNFNPQEQFPGSSFARSANGWIDSEIFQHWVEESFIPFTSHLAKPVFLFVDGHTSNISIKMHNMCKEAGIIYFTLPAHASHIVQPLDLILFKSLKTEWTKAVGDLRDLKGKRITKANFAVVLKDAWEHAYSAEKLVNAFEAGGLCPWNPDRVDYRKCAVSGLSKARTPTPSLLAALPSSSTASPEPSSSTPGPSTSAPVPCMPTPGPSRSAPGPSKSSNLGSDYVDKLLDLVVTSKWSEAKLFQMRRCFLEGKASNDPDYVEYAYLYSKIMSPPTFDSQPLPEQWRAKSKRIIRVQPPKFVTWDRFKEFFQKEEEQRKVKEREEKKKMKETEVEKKRAKRKAKGEGKKSGKRRMVLEDEVSSQEETVIEFVVSDDDWMMDGQWQDGSGVTIARDDITRTVSTH